MGPAILVFLVVAGAIVGGYVAVTRLPGALATRRLDQRLRDVSMPAWGANEELEETVIKPSPKGPLPAIDRMVASSWMQRLIEQSGVNTTPSALLLISIGVAAALGRRRGRHGRRAGARAARDQAHRRPADGGCLRHRDEPDHPGMTATSGRPPSRAHGRGGAARPLLRSLHARNYAR